MLPSRPETSAPANGAVVSGRLRRTESDKKSHRPARHAGQHGAGAAPWGHASAGRLDAMYAGECLVQLAEALGELSRSGLQDVVRFHFEDAIVPDGAHAIPAGPADDRRFLHPLSTPRREDDLRIPACDLRRVDDAIPRELRVRELRKDRRTACDLDELFHPPDPGDERLVPFLEERA